MAEHKEHGWSRNERKRAGRNDSKVHSPTHECQLAEAARGDGIDSEERCAWRACTFERDEPPKEAAGGEEEGDCGLHSPTLPNKARTT